MRLAFVGGWGHHYLRRLIDGCRHDRITDVAVAGDGHDNREAKKLADKISNCLWYENPVEMLDKFAPDFVSIGTIYGFNAELIILALERDIPTVSEKPIAASWQQLHAIRELAGKRKCTLITEFNFRSVPAFRAARQAVADGLIGKVVLSVAQKSYKFGARPSWYADRTSYSGTMLWVASHAIDAIQFTTGKRFKRVFGRQSNLSKPDYGSMEDHCVVIAELQDGATAVVHADFLRPSGASTHADDRLRLAGSTGVLEIRSDICRLTTENEQERDITDSVTTRPVHEEMLAAIQAESTDLYSTDLSLDAAAVLLTCRDAADKQQIIEVPNIL